MECRVREAQLDLKAMGILVVRGHQNEPELLLVVADVHIRAHIHELLVIVGIVELQLAVMLWRLLCDAPRPIEIHILEAYSLSTWHRRIPLY